MAGDPAAPRERGDPDGQHATNTTQAHTRRIDHESKRVTEQRRCAHMPSKAFLPPEDRMTLSMLKRTVLESGRHWPARISSPTLTRKAGETWMGVFLWRFSNRLYFLM